jgi:hypothetical protein
MSDDDIVGLNCDETSLHESGFGAYQAAWQAFHEKWDGLYPDTPDTFRAGWIAARKHDGTMVARLFGYER